MKITKKAGKLVVTATAEELRKNPKLAAAIRKAQGLPPAGGAGGAVADPAAEAPDAGGGLELPTDGGDLGGPGDIGAELGGDALDGGVDPELGGDKNEQFAKAVDQAFQDAFGKPMDEGMKQVLQGLAQIAGGGETPATDDLDATDGALPGGDKDPLALPEESGPGDLAPPPGPEAGADPAGGIGGLGSLAKSKGRLTKVASGSAFVNDFIARLTK